MSLGTDNVKIALFDSAFQQVLDLIALVKKEINLNTSEALRYKVELLEETMTNALELLDNVSDLNSLEKGFIPSSLVEKTRPLENRKQEFAPKKEFVKPQSEVSETKDVRENKFPLPEIPSKVEETKVPTTTMVRLTKDKVKAIIVTESQYKKLQASLARQKEILKDVPSSDMDVPFSPLEKDVKPEVPSDAVIAEPKIPFGAAVNEPENSAEVVAGEPTPTDAEESKPVIDTNILPINHVISKSEEVNAEPVVEPVIPIPSVDVSIEENNDKSEIPGEEVIEVTPTNDVSSEEDPEAMIEKVKELYDAGKQDEAEALLTKISSVGDNSSNVTTAA